MASWNTVRGNRHGEFIHGFRGIYWEWLLVNFSPVLVSIIFNVSQRILLELSFWLTDMEGGGSQLVVHGLIGVSID